MKAKIDKWYKSNYDNVKLITKMHIARLGKNLDPEALIADSYLYVIGREPKDDAEIERMVYGFIWFELTRWNSKTNRNIFWVNEQPSEDLPCNQNTDILLNIDIESFENTLDRIERIVWDVYYHRGISTKRALAEHFQIDDSSAFLYIKAVKDKFKEYAKTENRL
jgi:hypothetical protein